MNALFLQKHQIKVEFFVLKEAVSPSLVLEAAIGFRRSGSEEREGWHYCEMDQTWNKIDVLNSSCRCHRHTDVTNTISVLRIFT